MILISDLHERCFILLYTDRYGKHMNIHIYNKKKRSHIPLVIFTKRDDTQSES